MIADPFGDILGRRVEGKDIVQVLMVELGLDRFLDVTEIDNHTVRVECRGLTIDGDDPVVTVQVLALAGIGEAQVVRGRDFHSFNDCVHNVK